MTRSLKTRIALLLLSTLICGSAQAFKSSIEIIEQFDDVKLVAFIDENHIKDYPLWHPLTEAPPLSVQAAIMAVKNLQNSNDKSSTVKAISEIELRELAHHKDYWHYLVKTKTGNDDESRIEVYVVLMNGKVIPAAIETESYK